MLNSPNKARSSGAFPLEEDPRPVVAAILSFLPPWLVANFNACATDLRIVTVETGDAEGTSLSSDQRLAERLFARRLVDEKSAAGIERALDDERPDVVLTSGWAEATNIAATRWALKRGKPLITATDSNLFDFKRTAIKEAIKRRVVRFYQVGWAASVHSAEYLELLGMEKRRIVVGPVDTVDNEHFELGVKSARSSAGEIRKRYKLPDRYFISVSRFAPEKNLHTLIDAYALYRRRCESGTWDLVMVGDGPLRASIEDKIHALGLNEHVRQPGWISFDVLPAYYALASGFMLPSSKDTWGVVVNEAAVAGLPLLVSKRAGSSSHLVKSGQNGFTIDPFDVQDIADRMWTISHGGLDLDAMGRVSRLIIEGWTPQRYAESLTRAARLALALPQRRQSWMDFLLVEMLLAKFTQDARKRSGARGRRVVG